MLHHDIPIKNYGESCIFSKKFHTSRSFGFIMEKTSISIWEDFLTLKKSFIHKCQIPESFFEAEINELHKKIDICSTGLIDKKNYWCKICFKNVQWWSYHVYRLDEWCSTSSYYVQGTISSADKAFRLHRDVTTVRHKEVMRFTGAYSILSWDRCLSSCTLTPWNPSSVAYVFVGDLTPIHLPQSSSLMTDEPMTWSASSLQNPGASRTRTLRRTSSNTIVRGTPVSTPAFCPHTWQSGTSSAYLRRGCHHALRDELGGLANHRTSNFPLVCLIHPDSSHKPWGPTFSMARWELAWSFSECSQLRIMGLCSYYDQLEGAELACMELLALRALKVQG